MLLPFLDGKGVAKISVVNKIPDLLIEYEKYNPSELQRTPRFLNEVVNWKVISVIYGNCVFEEHCI